MSSKKSSKTAVSNGSAVDKVAPVKKGKASEKKAVADKDQAGNVTTDKSKVAPELSPEAQQKLGELRSKVQTSVGQVVLAMMNLPRYRNQSLADLNHLVIEPLLRDRLAIASSKSKDGSEPEAIAGFAIWASVSEEVDVKVAEQIKSGSFPVRLSADDWVSGDKFWLLDVIAPNRELATAVLRNFSQVAKGKPVSIHPIVARSIESEVLEKMRT